MSDWNKHHGVGATLLENWVEERSVGDTIIKERSDICQLSRNGHKDLLTHSTDTPQEPMQTTSRASYKLVSRSDLASQTVGKRRQLMEAEMLKIAISGQKSQPQINESKQWESTTMHDFCHSDVYPPLVKLGSKLPDQSQSDKYAKPITFWSDYAAKGSGTAVCSTPAKYLHKQGYSQEPNNNEVVGHRAGQIHEMQASDVPIRFGKHPTFSCPIHENRFEKE